MPVRFEGQELIPAPRVTISRRAINNANGDLLYHEHTYNLQGTIVNVGTSQDSPDAQGHDFGNMNGVLAEQARIRSIFSQNGGRLELETPGGGGPDTVDAYCQIESVYFDDKSVWTTQCGYTIVLSSVGLADEDITEQLESASENWQFQEEDDGTYSVSHDINAIGALDHSPNTQESLGVARTWCQARLYTNASGTLVLPSGSAPSGWSVSTATEFDFDSLHRMLGVNTFWNRVVSESPGPTDRSWQITESFVWLGSGNAREEYSIITAENATDPRKNTISIQGTVFGYAEDKTDYPSRNSNAGTMWNTSVKPNLYTRAANVVESAFAVNPEPNNKSVTYEKNAGNIRYNYSFLAVSGALIDNALEENIVITDNGPTDVFAQIPVPGRSNGPVVQYMNTITLPKRSLSITATIGGTPFNMNSGSLLGAYNEKPNTDSLVNALVPDAGYYYMDQNNEQWSPIKRQYSRNVSWTLQSEGQSVNGTPEIISNPND